MVANEIATPRQVGARNDTPVRREFQRHYINEAYYKSGIISPEYRKPSSRDFPMDWQERIIGGIRLNT